MGNQPVGMGDFVQGGQVSKRKAKDILFEDGKGRQVILTGSWTIADMVHRGIDFHITPKEEPLPPEWFRAVGEVPTPTKEESK